MSKKKNRTKIVYVFVYLVFNKWENYIWKERICEKAKKKKKLGDTQK